MIRHLNRLSDQPTPDEQLESAFDEAWDAFDQTLQSLDITRAELPDTDEADGEGQSEALIEVGMGRIGTWRDEQILLGNVGTQSAHNIRVAADDVPIEEAEYWVGNQEIVSSLRPGETVGLKIALSMGSPERTDLEVSWTDDEGRAGATRRLITLI
jgi:hypothetical protein